MKKLLFALLFVFVAISSSCSSSKNIETIVGWVNGLGFNERYSTSYDGYNDDCLYNGKIIMNDDQEIFYIIGDGERWVNVEIEYKIVLDAVVIRMIEIEYINTTNQTRYKIGNYNYTVGVTTIIGVEEVKKIVKSLSIQEWVEVLTLLAN